MYRIVFLNGKLKGRRLTVRQGAVRIGRAPDCSVRLTDPTMADHHALIEERDGRLFLKNLDPVQGVQVGGQKLLTGELELGTSGDLVLGGTRLRVEIATVMPTRRRHRVGATQTLASLSVAGVLVVQVGMMVHYSLLCPNLQATAGPAVGVPDGRGAPPGAPTADPGTGTADTLPPDAIPPSPDDLDSKDPGP